MTWSSDIFEFKELIKNYSDIQRKNGIAIKRVWSWGEGRKTIVFSRKNETAFTEFEQKKMVISKYFTYESQLFTFDPEICKGHNLRNQKFTSLKWNVNTNKNTNEFIWMI